MKMASDKLSLTLFLRSFVAAYIVLFSSCSLFETNEKIVWTKVQTFAGTNSEIGEPFGVAFNDGHLFVSDGEKGEILRFTMDGTNEVFAEGLDTPSQIVFDGNGDLLVADSESHSIKKIASDGSMLTIAGVENRKGFKDGDAKEALFNAPIGIAVYNEKIFVADTYNDRIRVIENGRVSTLAGGEQGFADGSVAKFNTPTGLAAWTDGRVLVADSQNYRVRVVENDGRTWTLAGNGRQNLTDGLPLESEFVQPTALALDKFGSIYVADGNAIRVIGRRSIPIVETISNDKHGFADGKLKEARFNRPSGLVFDDSNDLLIADSANQLIRAFTGKSLGDTLTHGSFEKAQTSSKAFRKLGEPRWTYNPPTNVREIAGTLGEIRGEIKAEKSQAWFHNGLDIVGGYGETARFIRDEKILRPIAVQNFQTTRELVRLPTIGYIHIRLGRDVREIPFNDERFQFSKNEDDELTGVRIPRGTKFKAGEAIGTLNTFNHVHLIAGRSGREMNALDALVLPDASDSRIPKIEKVTLFEKNWTEIETEKRESRIKLGGKVRIVVRAFDQMDGNAKRRKLGLYKIGYQVFDENGDSLKDFSKPKWNIIFDKTPENDTVELVYAVGSKSGATGETIFNYIATNEVSGTRTRESFLDTTKFSKGIYILRVLVADFFGNTASEDIEFEIEN